MEILKAWFRRSFSDPQVVILGLFLLIGFAVVFGLGKILAPVFTSIIIAYLLEAIVVRLESLGLPRWLAVILVFLFFMAILVFILFGLVPQLSRQLTQLVQQFPAYINQGQELLKRLPETYPQLVSEQQIQAIMSSLGEEVAGFGQRILTWSLSSVVSIVTLLIFVVLIPVLVFFFLKDKTVLTQWFVRYLPKDRHLVSAIWDEVDDQIGNYVRGKVLEILIVGSVTYVVFTLLGLQYAALLATLVGFSVLIPYVGAAVATLPVALVAFFQWGWGLDLWWVLLAYGVIQALDGNVLVPLLFSEVVNLHPVAIIIAVLVFGGLWGFWGVFFAIPLATLVQAILRAWPRVSHGDDSSSEEKPESAE